MVSESTLGAKGQFGFGTTKCEESQQCKTVIRAKAKQSLKNFLSFRFRTCWKLLWMPYKMRRVRLDLQVACIRSGCNYWLSGKCFLAKIQLCISEIFAVYKWNRWQVGAQHSRRLSFVRNANAECSHPLHLFTPERYGAAEEKAHRRHTFVSCNQRKFEKFKF